MKMRKIAQRNCYPGLLSNHYFLKRLSSLSVLDIFLRHASKLSSTGNSKGEATRIGLVISKFELDIADIPYFACCNEDRQK